MIVLVRPIALVILDTHHPEVHAYQSTTVCSTLVSAATKTASTTALVFHTALATLDTRPPIIAAHRSTSVPQTTVAATRIACMTGLVFLTVVAIPGILHLEARVHQLTIATQITADVREHARMMAPARLIARALRRMFFRSTGLAAAFVLNISRSI